MLSQGLDPSVVDYNNNAFVDPLYEMTFDQYWGHKHDGVTFNLLACVLMFLTTW